MKTAFALILMLWATTAHVKEIPDGFNGYPWGTSYKSIDSLTFGIPEDTADDGSVVACESNVKTIGDCKATKCTIWFLDGDLSGVTLGGKGHDLFRCLYALMVERYGQPQRPNAKAEIYTFDTRFTTVFLVFSSDTKGVVVSIKESVHANFERYAKKRLGK